MLLEKKLTYSIYINLCFIVEWISTIAVKRSSVWGDLRYLLRADADLSQEHEEKTIYLYRQHAGIIGISQCILTAGS